MRSRLLRGLGGLAAAWLAAAVPTARPALAVTDIQLWHAMPGELGYQLDKLAKDFNASQTDYRVVPVFKGLYTETMLAALFAMRLREHPAIVQVAEVATATMMAAKSAIIPVFELMRDEHEPFNPAAYLPVIAGYYADTDGNMLSFPLNASTPILFYNKDQFRFAGLNADQPPKTWPEVEAAAEKLRAAGYACGFTTHYPSWVNVENFLAFHDLPIATRGQRHGRPRCRARHRQSGDGHASRGAGRSGRRAASSIIPAARPGPSAKFLNRECGIFLGSSASRADFLTQANFEVGFGMLPYWPDVAGAPRNSIIGGGSLWVLRDRTDAEYKGVGDVLRLSVAAGRAGHMASGDRLSADHAAPPTS